MQFVHLHTHSEFSLLDGACRLPKMVEKAAALGMPAVALTDHGVMYGVVPFYQEARKAGIKPIIGCEVYVARGSRFDRGQVKEKSNYHLTLLAKDNTGYINLMHLASQAFLEGFYYKPRVDIEALRERSAGLIALSGCMGGEISRELTAGNRPGAIAAARTYLDIFGRDDFFIEIQDQGLDGQRELCVSLVEVAREVGLGIVATNDVHYLEEEDSEIQDILLCIQTGKTVADTDRMHFDSNQFYFKSPQEMAETFKEWPEALEATVRIAERCNVELDLGKFLLPDYEVPEGHTLESYLEELCLDGFGKKYQADDTEARNRLEHELGIIKQTGFAGYFLIVWDFISFAKGQGIRVGPGRGSGAGSIVAYVLDITNVDPLPHGLLFERFLNPERISMPDLDIDFCYERRGEVIEYVTKKYGEDKVAQIITFGTMMARAAVRDAGRALGFAYGKVDRIAKMIPEVLSIKIEDALKTSDELREVYANDTEAKRLIDVAAGLEGMARHDSVHAAGVVIAKETLPNHVPLQRKSGADVVTQYPMNIIESIGLLKMDFLGLRTLTVIDKAVKIVRRTRGIEVDIDAIDMNDKETFKMLRRGETLGVFQLESSGMRGLLRKLVPTVFADIVALVALYRPGPMQGGLVDAFVERKHGRGKSKYLHPLMKPILEDTYGVIVYQEQVMRLATDLAGYTLGEADVLRKAMGKKQAEMMAEQRHKFVDGCVANDITKKLAVEVFEQIDHFAGYGFNKSHSVAYAMISVQTAYLKHHYPVEYMAAILTSIIDNKDKVALYVNECRRLGIEVRPPCVNESYSDFTVVGPNNIRFGMAAIRNVGEGPTREIVKAREADDKFASIFDFCRRVENSALNKRVLESLIKSGAMDAFGNSRKHHLSIYEKAIDDAASHRKHMASGQFSMFDLSELGQEPQAGNADIEEMPKPELLAAEKEMLGIFVSDNPLLEIADRLADSVSFSLGEAKDHEKKDGAKCVLGGIVAKVNKITTRKGEPMAFVEIEDLEGSIEAVIFPRTFESNAKLLAKDTVIIVSGRLDRKDDEVKIIVESIAPLGAESAFPLRPKTIPKLFLRVTSETLDAGLLADLDALFRKNPGKSEVYLELLDDGKTTTMRLSRDFLVDPTAVLSPLRGLLGGASVNVVQ